MSSWTEPFRAPPLAAADTIAAASIIAEIKAAGVEYVVTLPDIVTSKSLLASIATDRDFRHIKVCKEDEGIGICAGLSFCDKRALLLIQSTGLLDSINALKAVAVEYSLPICIMVGLIGKEIDRAPRDSQDCGVRIIEPILDAMGVTHCLLEAQSDASLIRSAIRKAYEYSTPTAMLLGRAPRMSS